MMRFNPIPAKMLLFWTAPPARIRFQTRGTKIAKHSIKHTSKRLTIPVRLGSDRTSRWHEMRKHCSHRLQDSDKCETCNRDNWRFWREDYRCERPAVSCEGCDTFYPRGQSATQMKFDGFRLVFCSECRRRNEIQKVSQRMQTRLHSTSRSVPTSFHPKTSERFIVM